jgi:hypothetical protein
MVRLGGSPLDFCCDGFLMIFLKTILRPTTIDTRIYHETEPRESAAFALFADDWITVARDACMDTTSFAHDERIERLLEAAGGLEGQSVLELGPLEGAHTRILEAAGAGSVLSIEANTGAFLRCLIAKNHLGLRARFLLGDFGRYLRNCRDRFDFVLAAGVLYHLTDPVSIMRDLVKVSNRIGISTQVFDPDHPFCASFRFTQTPLTVADGEGTVRLYRHQNYPFGLRSLRFVPKYMGGSASSSMWMRIEDIAGFFKRQGFRFDVLELRDTPHGPLLLAFAERL